MGKLRGFTVRNMVVGAAFVAVCLLTGAAGSLFVEIDRGQWYSELSKPPFTPPSWVFGPVWTCLYVCIGLAAWSVWKVRGFRRAAIPLGLFAVQLLLNALWTPLFFGLQRPGLAFAEILVLWVMIAAAAWRFFKISRIAGWLMVPYLLWVAFAGALNFSIWRLNT